MEPDEKRKKISKLRNKKNKEGEGYSDKLHARTDSSEQREAVKEYVASTRIRTGYVLGANQNDRINDESVRIIFHMTDMDLIEEY